LVKLNIPKLASVRLAVVMLGDRLGVAAIERDRVETFTIEAENPAAALRAELDARSVAVRTVAIGLSRSTVTVKPIELPAVAGATQDMVKFELERHLPIPADDAAFDFVALPPDAEADAVPVDGKRVLIAAADRRLIDSALRLVSFERIVAQLSLCSESRIANPGYPNRHVSSRGKTPRSFTIVLRLMYPQYPDSRSSGTSFASVLSNSRSAPR